MQHTFRSWMDERMDRHRLTIEIWVEHSYVDGLPTAPGGPVIFSVEDLYTLHGAMVAWPPIKVQVLQHHT